MIPVHFPQENTHYGPPEGIAESQCMTIPACQRMVDRGSLDGMRQVIVAWRPTQEELQRIIEVAPIFVSMIGGLMPHALCTSFEEATNPA